MCPQITPPQKRGRVTLMTAKTINQRGRDTRPIQIQYPLLWISISIFFLCYSCMWFQSIHWSSHYYGSSAWNLQFRRFYFIKSRDWSQCRGIYFNWVFVNWLLTAQCGNRAFLYNSQIQKAILSRHQKLNILMTYQSIRQVIFMDIHMLLHLEGDHRMKWSSLFMRYCWVLSNCF